MAKMTVTLDTEDQTITVDIDGQSVGNINEISVSNWGNADDPKFSFYVTSCEKVGDVLKMTRLMAKESPEAVRAREAGDKLTPSRAIAGFVEVPAMSRAQEEMARMLRQSRGPRSR